MRPNAFAAALLLCSCATAPAAGPRKASYVETMKSDWAALAPTVGTPWVKAVLARVAELPPRAPRTVWLDKQAPRAVSEAAYAALPEADRKGLVREEEDDEVYYAKYSSPLAYARLLEVAAAAGLDGLEGKKVVDFGYGDIGQLQLFAKAGAEAVGVDPSLLDAALYTSPEDLAFPPGSVRLVSARWPAEAAALEGVGKDVDVFVSKNTLKKGYVRPEPPPGKTVDPKKLIKLGVAPEAFLPAMHAATKPGALVVLFNICSGPGTGPEWIPWSDGRSPFTKEEWAAAGFTLLAFDVDDSAKVRELARVLKWDELEKMDLQNDLFAWYTVARRNP